MLTLHCRQSDCRGRVRLQADSAGETSGACPKCGMVSRVIVDQALAQHGDVSRCAACNGSEFFIRKDFPQRLGLMLVILFGAVASVFYYFENIPATFGTLGSLVVVDALIYLFVGRVTVCYRCRAEYRGAAYNPDHQGFDLATSEKYDPAAARLERL